MAHEDSRRQEAARIRERLARLATETAELTSRLGELEAREPAIRYSEPPAGPVTNRSTPSEKIAFFRSLFCGREDVFPKRWENARTGRAGYAPACANEWKPRVCCKPGIKCGNLPQSGLPACNRRSDRGAPEGPSHDRRLSDPGRRYLPFPRRRLRQEDMAAGRGGPSSTPAVPSGFRRLSNVRVRATVHTSGSSLTSRSPLHSPAASVLIC